MSHVAFPSGRLPRRARRRFRGHLLTAMSIAALGAAVLARFAAPGEAPALRAGGGPRASAAPLREAAAAPAAADWLFDPTPVLRSEAGSMEQGAPSATAFRTASRPLPDPGPRAASTQQAGVSGPSPASATARFVQTVPLPVRRPAERAAPPSRLAERPGPPRVRLPAPEKDEAERSFFDTVFGAKPSTGPALAYAPLDGGAAAISPRRRLGPVPDPSIGAATAIYDISARTVTLPSGEVLEAHSGLGGAMDDPRYVHIRMRGATPPGTYDLTEREALFHGVRAIRLNPVGGPEAIHGRTGLLAHTYMLGASGASNGCISFKRYDRFLQAFLGGAVRRVVVVAGRGQDGFPAVAGRLFGRSASAQ